MSEEPRTTCRGETQVRTPDFWGQAVVLNGASSSGKTSIARTMQEQLGGWWLHFGIDTLITATPPRMFGTIDGHSIGDDGSISIGPGWRTAHDRWRAAMRSLIEAGADVILDEVFLEGVRDQERWRHTLRGMRVSWVGVRCDIEVAVAREAARNDRAPNLARAQSNIVHQGVSYDAEVDTTTMTAVDSAQRLIADLALSPL